MSKRLSSYKNLDDIWDGLNSTRFEDRYGARIALESLGDYGWIERIKTEDRADVVIQAMIALARITPSLDVEDCYNWLNRIDFKDLTSRQQLDLLRAYQLVMIRYDLTEYGKSQAIEAFGSYYPTESYDLNRELLKVLATSGDSTVIDKTLDMFVDGGSTQEYLNKEILERSEQYGGTISIIHRNEPQTRLLGYLESLSVIDRGWSSAQKDRYFNAFNSVFASSGGMSYKGFAKAILERAIETFGAAEEEHWLAVSGIELMNAADTDLADLPKPEGPGRNWTLDEAKTMVQDISQGDLENGERMYQASLCHLCHVVNGQGAPTGPDLSNLGSRFSLTDIVNAVIAPSESITDQYGASRLLLVDILQ